MSWLLTAAKKPCLRLLRPTAPRRHLGELAAVPDTVAAEAPAPEQALQRFAVVRAAHEAIAARMSEPRARVERAS